MKFLNKIKKFSIKKPKLPEAFTAGKIIFFIMTVTFGGSLLGEAIWDASVLHKFDPVDMYRIALFIFYVGALGNMFLQDKYSRMFHDVMHIAQAQEEQIAIMKRLLEAKASGDLHSIFDPKPKKKKKTEEEDLKN